MRTWTQNRRSTPGALWLCGAIAAAGLLSARFLSSLPAELTPGSGDAHETSLRATIEPARRFNLTAEYPGSVSETRVSAGSQVQKGEILLILENREISGQIETARKRLEVATARLNAARSSEASKKGRIVERERLGGARRDRGAAQERLNSFSVEESEHVFSDARQKVSEIRSLAGQGFATDAEVQAAEAREQAAGRELKAAREHHSRLKQEFDQTEIQVRLLQMRTLDPGSDIAVAEAEYEDADAALNVATERSGRLSVTAPGPGTVIDLPVHAGDWVSAGTLMVRIADLSSLLVSAPVTVGVAQRLTTGQLVRLRLPTDPPRRLDARISEVTLAPDSGQQAYLIRVLTPNPTPGVALVGLAAAIEINHFRRR